MADMWRQLVLAEELLVAAWEQAGDVNKAQLWIALDIVQQVRREREGTQGVRADA